MHYVCKIRCPQRIFDCRKEEKKRKETKRKEKKRKERFEMKEERKVQSDEQNNVTSANRQTWREVTGNQCNTGKLLWT
jgi:hypothetical protein